jgi:uncharacterized membrane protein
MLSFLNFGAKFVLLVPAIVLVWTIVIGGPVTEMPFGVQDELQFFSNMLAMVVDILPFMDVVFNVIIWGIQIKLVLLGVELFKFVLSLILN